MSPRGVVAAGHQKTVEAAECILRDGGNAFDAILASLFAACISESVLASLGGGGFLLCHTQHGQNVIYDFFTQTPIRKRQAAECDFYPIRADFGTVTQEFHIGMGSIATPGTVKGIFTIYRDLCRLPIRAILEPAIGLARQGIRINALHASIYRIIEKMYLSTDCARAVFANKDSKDRLPREAEIVRYPELAETLEWLAEEGERAFYEGEIGQCIIRDCQENGGHLTGEDLKAYRVERRRPLDITYRNARLFTNPPPSFGGTLMAFSLKLLEQTDLHALLFGSVPYLQLLATTMASTNKARIESKLADTIESTGAEALLNEELLQRYRRDVLGRAICLRGTTHMNVIDGYGNMASLSLSYGEGSGYVVPGTGIMLNNMLGEEDINPHGFHRWPLNSRMSSMMSPTLAITGNDDIIVTGSGGSNRIRTALLQVLINLIDFDMAVDDAVESPRIHFEDGMLNVEHGFDPKQIDQLIVLFPEHRVWSEKNLFFGGAHTAVYHLRRKAFSGAGDPRRGGVSAVIG
ncbi:MAG: gamma-glutamyltransferase [Gammaproteobacteria bacterium]|nr:gamma-glutamyltransferase [Gammaproteobacteria bacterium]MCI0591472.1 gamma-glutamyltransferase [Gammaproteobacteria bacterium]